MENVPAVVNIKTLKGRFIAHKFSTAWAVSVVKSVGKKKSVAGQFAVKYKFSTGWAVGVVTSVGKKKSVAGQFAVKYKSETYC